MKHINLVVIVAILLSAVGVLPAKAQKLGQDKIDACTAWRQLSEVINYLQLQDRPEFSGFSLQDAVAKGPDNSLLVSTKNTDFDMAFGNIMYGEEKGIGYKLSRYFVGGNAQVEFVEVLEAAGYVKGYLTGPTFWGSYQNVWQKKEGWKDPCSGSSGGSSVPELTAYFGWINLLYILLCLIGLEVLSKGRIPIPVRN